MADRVWYFAIGGNRQGPISENDLRVRIARGEIRADTLVWNSEMADWTKAGAVPGLIGAGAPATPPGAPALPAEIADGGQQGMPLIPKFGTWALLGYSLLVLVGMVLVIPAPWVNTWFYRWYVDHIELPNGHKVTFEGKPADIWYVLMANAALLYVNMIHSAVPLVTTLLSTLLYLLIIRWIFSSLAWTGQSERLRFTGSYWGLLGWSVLGLLSFITIIGWAWVATATLRWICRHIEGTHTQLSFVGSGWGLLWRSVLYVLSIAFIIPIPWTYAWIMRWYTSQFHLSARA